MGGSYHACQVENMHGAHGTRCALRFQAKFGLNSLSLFPQFVRGGGEEGKGRVRGSHLLQDNNLLQVHT